MKKKVDFQHIYSKGSIFRTIKEKLTAAKVWITKQLKKVNQKTKSVQLPKRQEKPSQQKKGSKKRHSTEKKKIAKPTISLPKPSKETILDAMIFLLFLAIIFFIVLGITASFNFL